MEALYWNTHCKNTRTTHGSARFSVPPVWEYGSYSSSVSDRSRERPIELRFLLVSSRAHGLRRGACAVTHSLPANHTLPATTTLS